MATYGIDFPFRDSAIGNYVRLTATPEKEVRANLIHLLLTRKGSRFLLPDFGTRLYEFIFEQNDMVSYAQIEEEIIKSKLDFDVNGHYSRNDIFTFEVKNQPELKQFLKIEDNSDKIILFTEYASFLKIYNEKTNIKEFESMLTNIDSIVELINSDFEK